MNNAILRVLNSVPINRAAYRVASQKGCSDNYAELSAAEALEMVARLQRKHRLLKVVLQIKTKAQHHNSIDRFKAGYRSNFRPTRALAEYVRVGNNIEAMCRRISELTAEERAERRRIGALENEWKAANPGWIWTGVVCVAPNGTVFDRRALQRNCGTSH